MDSTADNSSGALSPAAHGLQGNAAAAASVRCEEGVAFTVTEGNEVAEVVGGGAARVLGSESFLDATTGTRHHFVDVHGEAEAMLFLVSVNEGQRRVVDVRRLF
ncbi:unnamed protein product [Urochloa decumbens]|uniref:Uncharacterized protein n=1 Tax=Urochloa decumbens TaxID=240449 RepID=A0ABC9C2L1_9POAL